MDGCEFPCRLTNYKDLVANILPKKDEDYWCLSNECRLDLIKKEKGTYMEPEPEGLWGPGWY